MYQQSFRGQQIKEIAKSDFQNYACFVAMFLSYGEKGKIRMKSGVIDIQDHISLRLSAATSVHRFQENRKYSLSK